MQTFKNRTLAFAGAIVATFATVAASSPARAESFAVQIGDVDLGSAAGAAVADRRIRHAAAKVCGPMERSQAHAIRACRRDAVADAKRLLATRTSRVQIAAR